MHGLDSLCSTRVMQRNLQICGSLSYPISNAVGRWFLIKKNLLITFFTCSVRTGPANQLVHRLIWDLGDQILQEKYNDSKYIWRIEAELSLFLDYVKLLEGENNGHKELKIMWFVQQNLISLDGGYFIPGVFHIYQDDVPSEMACSIVVTKDSITP